MHKGSACNDIEFPLSLSPRLPVSLSTLSNDSRKGLSMQDLRFFAVISSGAQSLPVAATATELGDLVHGLPLGVYSSMRTFEHNKFLDLADHLARTVRSMQLLKWDYGLDEVDLRRALHEVCTDAPW